jgi:glycosyltransferase involved in cell wall biosynthesis
VTEVAKRPTRARPAPAKKAAVSSGKSPANKATSPEVSVIIPTYRRADRLIGVIGALAEQTLDTSRFEVIAIDNFSEDTTKETLDALAATVPFTLRVLQTTSNHGPAPARNLGWRAASTPIVAFLDDDCLPEPEWLAAGLSTIQADESLGVVQGRVRTPHDFNPINMRAWYHCQIIDGPTPYFEACNIFYRRAALEMADGYDESIGWWGEDTELGWRVVEGGWGRGFAAHAVVEHAVVARGWRWHFDNGLLEGNMVKIAGDHPGFRSEAFWRPWAFRREDAGFVCAMVGLVAALKFRPALLLALPYLIWRRPRMVHDNPLAVMAQSVAVDAGRSVSQLRGSLDHKVMVI